MPTEVTYQLADEYKDLSGGSVAVGGDGTTLDVVERLSGGKIATSDPAEIAALDSYPAVERTGTREVAAPSDDKLTGDALKARAAELEIEGRADMKADELRAAVADAEADQGGGE